MSLTAPHAGKLIVAAVMSTLALAAVALCSDANDVVPNGEPTYSTNFDGVENPISEGGAWHHTGKDWTVVATGNGLAFGTQSGTPSQPRQNLYNDSYAILSGFPSDHSASAVIYRAASIDGSCSHEFEILLRWSDDTNNARGYELNLNYDGGYAQIVRWNGPYGDFTVLGGGSYPGLKSGDVFMGTIVGNVITSYVNGKKIFEVTDNTYTSGNPGMGFFRGSCGSNSSIGFTSFQAAGSGGTVARPNPPKDLRAN